MQEPDRLDFAILISPFMEPIIFYDGQLFLFYSTYPPSVSYQVLLQMPIFLMVPLKIQPPLPLGFGDDASH